ncbi:MAG: VOC family protein [Candidatus Eremiobacteraeota bacterium]|nr:VOC family protein [Candidatus Eremiobacteraeota bacterium]
MLHHISFGVSNLMRSAAFYDAVLAPLGIVRVWAYNNAVGYGYPNSEDSFAIKQESADVVALSPQSHLAFTASTRESVTGFHAAAMARGARDEGAPALCPEYSDDYFAAFVRDPDGYRLEAVCRK